MRSNGVYRVRFVSAPADPHRKGLRAPIVHSAPRFREEEEASSRCEERSARTMAVADKAAL